MNIKDSFAHVGFTPEEKSDLTARLEQATKEGSKTNTTKRKIKRIGRGTVFGIAAAAVMTVGALAAVLNPSLRSWFDTTTPGAHETLESGIYRLDRSESYNGWTVTLDECVGDDSSVYIWVDITAPEGTVLAPPEDGYFQLYYSTYGGGSNMIQLPDEDPTDNQISCLIQRNSHNQYNGSLRGETVTIQIDPIIDCWWTDRLTEQAQLHEGSELTAAIRDHTWVFENVTLDFPDQTLRLEPNVDVPWLDGTTTVVGLEVSPLSVRIELEGGTCADYLAHANNDPFTTKEDTGTIEQDGLVLEVNPPAPEESVIIIEQGGLALETSSSGNDWWIKLAEMEQAMTVKVVLQDGTTLEPATTTRQDEGYRESADGLEVPYLALSRRYDDSSSAQTTRVIDPTQVDHVTVCGVDIPVAPSGEN